MTKEKAAPHAGFARKHRPQAFEQIIGQEAVSTTLRNALGEKTPAHAYLFFGPRGIGKTTTARILAKALNCKKGPTPEPCGKCDACLEIASSSAIDVLELDAATHTQVDRIREMIIETVSLAPARDRFKIFIIDEVHMLSTASFNALLKTLEEPPPHVVFILATTDPQKIPATIVSRCQRFRFRPMPMELLAQHLQKLCKEEGISAEPAALELLARAGGGSVRDAVSLLEQVQAYADGKLSTEKVRELLGSLPDKMVLDLAQAIVSKDAKAVGAVLEDVWKEGFDAGQLLRDLRERLHEAYLHRLGVGEAVTPEWRALAGGHSPETFGFLVGRTNRILESLRGADSPRLSVEQGLYGMLEAAYDLRAWVQRLEALERRLASGGAAAAMPPMAEPPMAAPAPPPRAAAPSPAPKPAPAPAEAASAGGADTWARLLAGLEADRPALAQDIRSAARLLGAGTEWRLVFKNSFYLERARNNQPQIEAVMATLCGRSVHLRFEIDEGTGNTSAPAATRQATAPTDDEETPAARAEEGQPAQDPGIKRVLNVFGGKVRQVKKK
ncbi:MAG: DNA polymerase III subunit gamma/tau [Elusimicrobia bacterium]|nr:DNA polymerase III subunit gamma/tau [Elusimicrobiota bacterium]